MTTLSIIIPDQLAQASQKAAKTLGISRTEFIRQAMIHELENFKARREIEMISNSLLDMKKDNIYSQEAAEIENDLNADLPQEEDNWWTKK